MRKAIEAGADVKARESSGNQRSALSLAAYGGNEAIVRLLLDKGAPVNGYSFVHAIPLAGAMDGLSSAKNPAGLAIVRLLLERGANPNFSWGDMSSGEAAIFNKQLQVLELLAKHGLKADVPVPPNHYSILQFAADDGNLDAVRTLLLAGANANALDKDGYSLLLTVKDARVREALRAAGGREIVPDLPSYVDQSTPAAALESFTKAVNRADVRAMALCVQRGRPQDADKRMEWLTALLKQDGIKVAASIKKTAERGDATTLIVETDLTTADGKPVDRRVKLSEPVAMRRTNGRWRIEAYSVVPGRYETISYLNELADDFELLETHGGGERRLSPIEIADAVECRVLLEVLADGLLNYAEKHGGLLSVTQETLLAKAAPEFAPEVIGHCRRDKSGKTSYVFNEKLANKKLSDIKDPDFTVLLYEGVPGKPAFRHGGQAMAAFCEGRRGLVSADMLKGQIGGLK